MSSLAAPLLPKHTSALCAWLSDTAAVSGAESRSHLELVATIKLRLFAGSPC